MRDDVDLTVVTHVRNREALQDDLLVSRAQVVFIDNEWIARPLHRISESLRRGGLSWTLIMTLSWPAYIAFEHRAWRRFGYDLAHGRFDLIHRLTPVSPTLGSPLASLSKVPMVLGPLNGGLPWPREFPGMARQENEWLVPFRHFHRTLPYYRSTYRALAAVISGSEHTATEVPDWFCGLREYLPENGIDQARFPLPFQWTPPQELFRFITIGRLVPYKGIDLVLEAMGRSSRLADCEFHILGDGPMRSALETQAVRLGLAQRVHFHGWVDHRELFRELRKAQAFVFPSLREFGGAVVLEAMSQALPCIIVDYGGPGEHVTEETGFALPMADRSTLVANLIHAMESLVADNELCARLGKAGARRVADLYTWSAKAESLVGIYRRILNVMS